MPVTYHVVVIFDRDEEGNLKPGEAREATNAAAAARGERTGGASCRRGCFLAHRRPGDGRLSGRGGLGAIRRRRS
jgi:hypothetical protein